MFSWWQTGLGIRNHIYPVGIFVSRRAKWYNISTVFWFDYIGHRQSVSCNWIRTSQFSYDTRRWRNNHRRCDGKLRIWPRSLTSIPEHNEETNHGYHLYTQSRGPLLWRRGKFNWVRVQLMDSKRNGLCEHGEMKIGEVWKIYGQYQPIFAN